MEFQNSDTSHLISNGTGLNCTNSALIEPTSIPITYVENLQARGQLKFQWQKICKLFKSITVEPPLFVYLFAFCLQDTLTTNLIVYKVCKIHYNYSLDICENLSLYSNEQISVQQYVTQLNMYRSLIENVPAILFVLFMGAWSDRHGRKLVLALPNFGHFVSDLIILTNFFLWYLPPEYILLEAIPKALSGGFPCVLMISFSYITDICKKSNRTARIAFLAVAFSFGPSFGLLLSKVVFTNFGYIGTYIFSSSLYMLNILYIMIRIMETRGKNAKIPLEQEFSEIDNGNIMTLFDINNLKDTLSTVFKQRRNYGRLKIILLMCTMCCLVFTLGGANLQYLYTQKKFSWDYNAFVNFAVISIVIPGFGIVLLLLLLNVQLPIRDEYVAVAGCTSSILSKLIQGFSTIGYEMYIGAAVAVFSGAPVIICRSMLSKVACSSDTGKIFSALAGLESLLPLIGAPAYTWTYNATLIFFPGMFLFVEAFFVCIALVLFLAVYILNQRNGVGIMAEIES